MGSRIEGSPIEPAGNVPTASPDPGRNTGYAEPKPRSKEEAHIPGARQAPNSEEGGLQHEPDPKT